MCSDCKNLKTIYVEDGCQASLLRAWISDSVKIGPPPETMLGNAKFWDLRNCRQVVIPSGVEKIGNYWFEGADIEKITIPASVREIGADAFHGCEKLREIIFEGGSKLKIISQNCFICAGIKKIIIPKGVTEIQDSALCRCKNLKKVTFEEGSELKVIGEWAFGDCISIRSI